MKRCLGLKRSHLSIPKVDKSTFRIIIHEWAKKQRKTKTLRYYNEEFDPGSGWTLATGLTHASRGAAYN